ncbi:MAG: hypothetical protein VX910_02385, partial [Candidatus Latescibacterota bacterium]|nr:hypothetical protein [Candidatus Latescibacterota bacterium]
NRCVRIQYDRAALDVTLCHENELIMRSFKGWDHRPFGYEDESEVPEEAARYHLNVTSVMPVKRDVLVTVMCPYRIGEASAKVERIWNEGQRGASIDWKGNTYQIRAEVGMSDKRPLAGISIACSGQAGVRTYQISNAPGGSAESIWIDAEAVVR